MDAQQTQQWNAFACMSKALIKAAAVKNIELTPDQYCAKYENLFPDPQNQYGGLILSRFYWIARDIGLGNDMDLIWDYKTVNSRFNKDKFLFFIFSAVNLRQGHSDSFNHVSVLLSIDDHSFTLSDYPALPESDWIDKRCCGIWMA